MGIIQLHSCLSLKEIKQAIILFLFLIGSGFFSLNAQNSGKHLVAKGETAYSIAKKYSIPLDELYRLNPGIEKGLKDGQELNLAGAPVTPLSITDSIQSGYIFHKVQSKETLYAISKMHSVSVDVILNENPWAKEGLRPGKTLKIPKPGFEKNISETFVATARDTVQVTVAGSAFRPGEQSRPWNVSLFLPLHLGSSFNSSDTSDLAKHVVSSKTTPALEFYEGVFLAADSLKKLGYSFVLSVYDTRNDSGQIKSILKKPELKSSDLFLGPLQGVDVPYFVNYAVEKKIPHVLPFSASTALLAANPLLSTTTPSVRTQCEEMGKFMGKHFAKQNVVFIRSGSQREADLVTNFKAVMSGMKISAELVYPKQGTDSLKKSLSKHAGNVIVICSSDESMVNSLLGMIRGLRDTGITVVGMPTWENFSSLDYTMLENLNVHYFSTSFVNYELESTKQFSKLFRNVYGTEPSLYACQGFDVAFCMLKKLAIAGPDFTSSLPESVYEGLHSRFVFQKVGSGGMENKSIAIIRYEDFKLKKVNP